MVKGGVYSAAVCRTFLEMRLMPVAAIVGVITGILYLSEKKNIACFVVNEFDVITFYDRIGMVILCKYNILTVRQTAGKILKTTMVNKCRHLETFVGVRGGRVTVNDC